MDVTKRVRRGALVAVIVAAMVARGGRAHAEPQTVAQASAPSSVPSEPTSIGSAPSTGTTKTTVKARATSRTPAVSPIETAASDALVRIVDQPHTVAELEGGIIALPNAPISGRVPGGDTPILGRVGSGDATVQIGIHVLYRWNRSFAVGAGALFAPSPTSDDQYDLRSLPRSHSRTYLFLGTEARYIPIHYKFAEAWVGVSVGGVIVADRFSSPTTTPVPGILGTPEVTIRTEGFAAGLQLGGSYYLSENWIAGATLRGYQWFLPQTARCSSIGDCASLSGAVLAFELGLTIGYRLPL